MLTASSLAACSLDAVVAAGMLQRAARLTSCVTYGTSSGTPQLTAAAGAWSQEAAADPAADELAERRASHQHASTTAATAWPRDAPLQYGKPTSQQQQAHQQQSMHSMHSAAAVQGAASVPSLAGALHMDHHHLLREQQQQQLPHGRQVQRDVSLPYQLRGQWLTLDASRQLNPGQQQQQQWQQGPADVLLDQLQSLQQAEAVPTHSLAELFSAHPDMPPGLRDLLFCLAQTLDTPAMQFADLAKDCTRRATMKRPSTTWAPAAHVQGLAAALQQHAHMQAEHIIKLLCKRPTLLLAQHLDLAPQTLQQLQQALGLTPQQLLQLCSAEPALLEVSPTQLASQLQYLGQGALGLTPEQQAAVVCANPRLLVVPHTTWGAAVAFMVGLGVAPAAVQGMVLAVPQLFTVPIKKLILRWNYLRTEVKAGVEDVQLAPSLLLPDLHQRLGPRVSFARKQRFMVLLPSHTAGAPIFARPESWKQHQMVPLTWLLEATPKKVCQVLGVRVQDFDMYKEAWQTTEGLWWRQFSLAGGPGSEQQQDQPPAGGTEGATAHSRHSSDADASPLLLMKEPRRGRSGAKLGWRPSALGA